MLLTIQVAGLVTGLAVGAGAPPPTSPTEVSPVDVTSSRPVVQQRVDITGADDWMYRPPNALILSVWPPAAYEDHINGHADLTCKVDAHGLAEECRVASESPPGKGFGKAALLLRPTFKLRPASGPDGPVDSTMTIGIEFRAQDNEVEFHLSNTSIGSQGMDEGAQTSIKGTPPEMRAVTMLDHPVWAQAASFDDLAHAYPARGGGVEGFAVAHCHVERSGALTSCEPRKEVPLDRGFATAAASLGTRFRVEIDPARIPHGPPLWVDIPIRFPPPGADRAREVASPTWIAGFDPNQTVKLFPPEAIAQGLTTGRGLARCVVARDGSLTDCTAMPGEPDGLGFSEAAVKMASSLRMNPWTADGAPVDGAVIRLPIRFNLKTPK